MVKTFDFIFHLQRNEEMRREYNIIMDSGQNHEFDYRGWHLYFDGSRKWVVVTNNHTDKLLDCKILPGEMSYDTLRHLMDLEKIHEEYEFEMRWIDD